MPEPVTYKLNPRKLSAFVGISLLCHLAVAAGLAGFTMDLDLPKPDITWLDLDNTLGAPRRATPRSRPKPRVAVNRSKPKPQKKWAINKRPAQAAKNKKRKKIVRPKPDAGIRPDAGPFTTDQVALSSLAPGDAALILLLRMDRLRKSPYEREVRQLLEVFYDHKTLLWTSGLDPIRDFEAMLIATPNPYRVTRTFLAVRHNLPSRRMRRSLARAARYKRKRMRWRRHSGGLQGTIPSPPRHPKDPRVVILKPNVVMLTDPSHIPLLALKPAAAGRAPDAGVHATPWIQRLEQMEGTGGQGGEGPGMLLQAINLPRLIRLPPDFKTPLTFRLTIPASEPADLNALLTFASDSDAKIFLAAIPLRIKRFKRSLVLRFMGIPDLLEQIKTTRKGKVVEASVTLTGDQVRALLGIFRNIIPQVKVPGMRQRRLPDAGLPDSRRPDSGAPDAGVPDVGGTAPDIKGHDQDPAPEIVKPSWAK